MNEQEIIEVYRLLRIETPEAREQFERMAEPLASASAAERYETTVSDNTRPEVNNA